MVMVFEYVLERHGGGRRVGSGGKVLSGPVAAAQQLCELKVSCAALTSDEPVVETLELFAGQKGSGVERGDGIGGAS